MIEAGKRTVTTPFSLKHSLVSPLFRARTRSLVGKCTRRGTVEATVNVTQTNAAADVVHFQ